MLKYYNRHKFIFAAGLAAFIHSTWSFAVIMSGELPHLPALGSEWYLFANWSLKIAYQLIPAALMAYAIDVGQIEAAEKIREGNKSLGILAAFTITAVFTFYLQFLFMIHHMPALEVSAGAAPAAAEIGVHLRNAAIWIMPALLPLALIVRMSSDEKEQQAAELPAQQQITAIIKDEEFADLIEVEHSEPLFIEDSHDGVTIRCPECDWIGTGYASDRAAANALNAHKRHCLPVMSFSSNGNNH